MSQLAQKIEEIREAAGVLLERTAPPAPVVHTAPDNFERPAFVGVALLAMREMLNRVPPAFWSVGPTKLTIACGCRRAHRVPNTIVSYECKCGRIFLWSGRSLYALKREYL